MTSRLAPTTDQVDGFLAKAVEAYRDFSAASPPDDAKGFAAHQAACKAALAHLEALLKLARLVGDLADATGDNDMPPINQAARLIADARAGLATRAGLAKRDANRDQK